jgi:hypothetical protein
MAFDLPQCAPIDVDIPYVESARTWEVQTKATEATLPQESACTYKLIPIDTFGMNKTSQAATIFDGYSPFMDYMMHDAQLNIQSHTAPLSPASKNLFPGSDPYSLEDIGINAIDVNFDLSLTESMLSENQRKDLNKLLHN